MSFFSNGTFTDAWMLWFLVPLYLLWTGAILWSERHRKGPALQFSSLRVLKTLKPGKKIKWQRWVKRSRLAVLALLVLAAAHPQAGRSQTEVLTEGVDIVLAIDTSGSMRAVDLDSDRPIEERRNRLQVVQGVVNDFVAKRPYDQIGMVIFGTEAFTQCPLTLDHGMVRTFVDRLEIGMAGEQTAIGDALGAAVKRLKNSKAKSKIAVLLTDGQNTAGILPPAQAAELAKTLGIKVYTIAAGTRGQAPFLVDSFFGKRVVYENVEIDEALLTEIAQKTGGQMFRAEDKMTLEAIYGQIDALEKTEVKTVVHTEYTERYAGFLGFALLLLILERALLGTALRTVHLQ